MQKFGCPNFMLPTVVVRCVQYVLATGSSCHCTSAGMQFSRGSFSSYVRLDRGRKEVFWSKVAGRSCLLFLLLLVLYDWSEWAALLGWLCCERRTCEAEKQDVWKERDDDRPEGKKQHAKRTKMMHAVHYIALVGLFPKGVDVSSHFRLLHVLSPSLPISRATVPVSGLREDCSPLNPGHNSSYRGLRAEGRDLPRDWLQEPASSRSSSPAEGPGRSCPSFPLDR